MKLTILVIILIIFCLLMIILSNNTEKFTPQIKEKKYDYTSTNARQEDKFISLWNRELFGNNVPITRNYIVDYHYIVDYPNLENSFNIILDSEPADISKTNPNFLITSKKEKIPNVPKVYLPYFVWAFSEKKMDPEILIRENSNNKKLISSTNRDLIKNKFCCFMYSNCREYMDGVRERKKFYEIMQKMTNNRVDNLGRCYNDNYKYNGPWTDQISIYEPYKFVIAFENSKLEGYITEKLAFPLAAKAIPIYYGDSQAKNYFNKKSFIDVSDFPNYESCIEYILKIDQDENLYNSIINEPPLIDNKIDKNIFSMYYGGKFYYDLYNNLNSDLKNWIRPCKFFSNNIRLITFSDDKIYKNNRILEEAYDSGYFKDCIGFTPKDFDQSFEKKHSNFIKNNSRGFGYWIWKPYFILKNLYELKNGDYLVWLDSGSTINSDNPLKVKEYFSILENFDMIMFRINHDEKTWSKMDTINHIFSIFNHDKNDSTIFDKDPKQRTAGMFMMKKNTNTLSLIKLWYDIACNYHLLDDSPSVSKNDDSFIENRHDQTILSIISKFHKNIFVSDDNFSDHPLDDKFPDNSSKPFYLSRKKA